MGVPLARIVLHRTASPFIKTESCDWKDIRDLIPEQSYSPGTELFMQGSPARDLYLIDDGLVKLVCVSQSGRELIVDICFPNCWLGSAASLLRQPHPVSAFTLTRCRLRRVPVSIIMKLLETDLAFSLLFQLEQSRESYRMRAQTMLLGCCCARDRLEDFLWRITQISEPLDHANGVQFRIPLKQWELAQLVAVTPPYLCDLIRQLKKDGVLTRQNGELVISSPNQLNRLGNIEAASPRAVGSG